MSEHEITLNETLDRTGLNWKVRTEGLKTESGIIVPKGIALVREDTNQVLGTHKQGYVPYQNEELLELLYKIQGQTGLELHTGGYFNEGAKVWFQLKSNDLKIGLDTIKGFVSGFNSFDGKTALAFGNSEITVSCQNTFWRGYRQVDTRLRHSASMKPKIEEILSRIDLVVKEEQTMFKEITRLHEIRMTDEVKQLVAKKLFDITVEDRLDVKLLEELSTRKGNQIGKFFDDLNMETATKGDNLWGLFSGVTRYTTHSMKKGDNSEAKMFGRTGAKERAIYQELVEMVM